MLTLTVVVPTRNEAPNIEPLTSEISRYVPFGTKLIFVDDSTDEQTIPAMEFSQRFSEPQLSISIVHRQNGDRTNGLAGAVTLGISLATTDYVLVMDGDLQHPPETIPALLAAAQIADLVVASRYCSGGSNQGLENMVRHLVSRMSTWAAKLLFPRALRHVSDPMTGFFLMKRLVVDPSRLKTGGFKILLEILVRHPGISRTQVPFQFASRLEGDSKGSFKQGIYYLRQLAKLRIHPGLK